MRKGLLTKLLTGVGLLAFASSAVGDWSAFVIRNATSSGASPAINDVTVEGQPAKEFVIAEGGQKAGWGTSALDGATLGDILRIGIARLDDRTRFTAGSGPYVAPYFNVWITNGNGKFAVIGNEPSNPDFQPLYSNGYDLDWADISNKPAKVYEVTDKSWLPNNGANLTFSQLAGYQIQAPTVAELTAGWDGLSAGAPRELGTNKAYGFNWVFGDTLSNYQSGSPGYVVADPVACVPSNYLISPPMLAKSKLQFSAPHGAGSNPFAYDWDSAVLESRAGAPLGYGSSSFYASVAQGATAESDRYRTLRIGMRDLFGQEVTVGDLARISYQTKKPAGQTAIDWRVSIYTTAGDYLADPSEQVIGAGDVAKWYRNRIQNHAPACLNLNAPADQWNLWSTDAGTNQMQFYTNRPGFTAENITFAELTSGTVTRGASAWDFSGEEVMMIDISLGANSGGGTGESQIDAITIALSDGRLADIDLTAGAEWKVATVHGHDQFTISPDKSGLDYDPQPRNTHAWYWYNNNGSPPGTLATGGFGPNGWRDGSRTFACTDIAAGCLLNTVKLSFEYKAALGYTTINYFLTDGNGKFGIFAPTSLGIAGVSTTEAVDAEWNRITLDLTGAIPDTTNVAIYEHNELSTEHVEPFTTMQWGDIKNLLIAGMYDYQRSPALGWDRWGTMFAEINVAGGSSLVNGYGLALIWGDTVGNTTYATNPRQIRNVEVWFNDVAYVGTFADAQVRDLLELNVPEPSLYVRPGESITVDMDVKNLQQMVKACQAMLGYSSTFFADPTDQGGDDHYFAVAPGGSVWDEVIWDSWKNSTGVPGEIDTAIGVQGSSTAGTQADGTVAKITLTVREDAQDDVTQLVFRPDLAPDPGLTKSTYLADMDGNAVWPTKFNSTTIVIDGTPPVITCPADVTVGCGQLSDPPATGQATATDANGPITIAYDDDRSGLNGCNATGVIVRTWTATDAAGNTSSCVQTITVVDDVAPVIAGCPSNITQSTDPGQCTAVVTYTPPTATDECYTEGFEDDQFQAGAPWTNDQGTPSINWNDYNSHVARVVSGTDGIFSKSGTAHGVIDSTNLPAAPDDYSGAFNRLRGYSSVFGSGWKASVDVYIDLSDPAVAANTYGWDLSVAASRQNGTHLRDFIFHVAADDSAPGRVLVGASNNSNFAKRNDLDAINHHEISSSGWYTFEWVFRDAAGVLAVDLNLRGEAGTVLWTETRSSAVDLIASVVGGNRYMWFTFVAADRLAIDNTRLIRNVPVVCSHASGSAFPKGITTVTCTAADACGNTADVCSFDVTVEDHETPTATIVSVMQGDKDLLAAGAVALQGPVTITVQVSDNCDLSNAPVVSVSGMTVTPPTGSGGIFTCTVTVGPATANGPHTVDASIEDDADNIGNAAQVSFNVNKNQVTGQIELEGFVGASRAVTFVGKGGTTQVWTLTLEFTGGVAWYELTDVPEGTTAISAKTDWSLRRKLSGLVVSDGQLVADFTGASKLLGGDINGSNSINILDYSLLKTNWFTANAACDVTGDGQVNTLDYNLMKANWFKTGDPE